VGHISRSSSLLRMKTSRVRVSQFVSKTSGDARVDGVRSIITEVVSRSS
jgi:hypothetical protein